MEPNGSLLRVVAAILLTGVSLGVAQNRLVQMGGPGKGLEWIAREKTLDSLESIAPASAATPTTASPVVPPDMNDPMGIAAAPEGGGLPEIPDLGRPLQMQLPAVKKFFDAGAAVFVDARDPGEFQSGHIPGAISMPYDEVITDPARLEAFQAGGKAIIVYCGGGTCELSMNLGFRLVEIGQKKVLVFMGGWPEWQAAGYPVAKGAS